MKKGGTTLHTGLAFGGRRNAQYLRAILNVGLSHSQRRLVLNGKDVPDPELHDEPIKQLRNKLREIEPSLLQGEQPFPFIAPGEAGTTKEAYDALSKVLSDRLEQKKEDTILQNLMTGAGDKGLEYIRDHSTEVVHALVDQWNTELNSLVQLRKVLESLKASFGGIDVQIWQEIEVDIESIPVAYDKVGLLAAKNRLVLLRQEQKLFHDGLTATAKVRVGTIMGDGTAVTTLRQRISGLPKAEELRSLRDFLDEEREVPLTWALVAARVDRVCQMTVHAKGEGEENNTKSHHLANSAQMREGGGEDTMIEALQQAQLMANAAMAARDGERSGVAAGGGAGRGGGGGIGQHPPLPSRVDSSPGNCWNWESTGTCSWGADCRFIHRSADERAANPAVKRPRL